MNYFCAKKWQILEFETKASFFCCPRSLGQPPGTSAHVQKAACICRAAEMSRGVSFSLPSLLLSETDTILDSLIFMWPFLASMLINLLVSLLVLLMVTGWRAAHWGHWHQVVKRTWGRVTHTRSHSCFATNIHVHFHNRIADGRQKISTESNFLNFSVKGGRPTEFTFQLPLPHPNGG